MGCVVVCYDGLINQPHDEGFRMITQVLAPVEGMYDRFVAVVAGSVNIDEVTIVDEIPLVSYDDLTKLFGIDDFIVINENDQVASADIDYLEENYDEISVSIITDAQGYTVGYDFEVIFK